MQDTLLLALYKIKQSSQYHWSYGVYILAGEQTRHNEVYRAGGTEQCTEDATIS